MDQQMQPNKPSKKRSSPQMIIAISALILLSNGYCFSQSHKTGKTMKAAINDNQTKKGTLEYIGENDPIFITISNRAIDDLKKSVERSDPESKENKLIAAQIKTWTPEKQNKLPALFEKSIKEYTAQTQFDAETFLLVFDELGKKDQKKIAEEYDIRVQYLGEDKYVAEFWEDGLAVNSEANAVAYAHELANSEYAKKHPDGDVGNVEVVKKNYANTRKFVKDGKQERYTKMMALLYTIQKDGSVTFHDPGQQMIDFVKNNNK
ncbi:MAG: hypothetical protein D4R68_06955 [Ignavibacteriales bacterium]|nr:MAG: hypothetical protein D4R68_06955 [Ignavibacteriales bacterium]